MIKLVLKLSLFFSFFAALNVSAKNQELPSYNSAQNLNDISDQEIQIVIDMLEETKKKLKKLRTSTQALDSNSFNKFQTLLEEIKIIEDTMTDIPKATEKAVEAIRSFEESITENQELLQFYTTLMDPEFDLPNLFLATDQLNKNNKKILIAIGTASIPVSIGAIALLKRFDPYTHSHTFLVQGTKRVSGFRFIDKTYYTTADKVVDVGGRQGEVLMIAKPKKAKKAIRRRFYRRAGGPIVAAALLAPIVYSISGSQRVASDYDLKINDIIAFQRFIGSMDSSQNITTALSDKIDELSSELESLLADIQVEKSKVSEILGQLDTLKLQASEGALELDQLLGQ